MKRYHHTPNSNDVRQPLDGTPLQNVRPMGEEFYDREDTGPMFTAEAQGFDGVLHLFEDEIVEEPIRVGDWVAPWNMSLDSREVVKVEGPLIWIKIGTLDAGPLPAENYQVMP